MEHRPERTTPVGNDQPDPERETPTAGYEHPETRRANTRVGLYSEEVEGLLRDERNVAAYTGAAADSYAGTWDLGLRDRGLRKSAMIPDDETERALPKRLK